MSSDNRRRDREDTLIREAEKSKARIYDVAGKDYPLNNNSVNHALLHSLIIDEEYSLVRGHINENLRKTIEKGGHVDFAKLLHKDRVEQENDTRLEIRSSQGATFLAPYSDQFLTAINSLFK